MDLNSYDWLAVFNKTCESLENTLECSFFIDKDILNEVDEQTRSTLEALKIKSGPNVAKVAGHVAFWIRKLKPISYAKQPDRGKFLAVNELVGLLVGLGICHEYFDDKQKAFFRDPPQRILFDWVFSFRVHSHSPHSSQIAFELLANAR